MPNKYQLGFKSLENEMQVGKLPVKGAIPQWLTAFNETLRWEPEKEIQFIMINKNDGRLAGKFKGEAFFGFGMQCSILHLLNQFGMVSFCFVLPYQNNLSVIVYLIFRQTLSKYSKMQALRTLQQSIYNLSLKPYWLHSTRLLDIPQNT